MLLLFLGGTPSVPVWQPNPVDTAVYVGGGDSSAQVWTPRNETTTTYTVGN
jgi:hypothetical protein